MKCSAHKVLSVVVSLLMAICCCPVGAFAAESADAVDPSNAQTLEGTGVEEATPDTQGMTGTLPVVDEGQGSASDQVSGQTSDQSSGQTPAANPSDASKVASGSGGSSEAASEEDTVTPAAVEPQSEGSQTSGSSGLEAASTDPTDIASGKCGTCTWRVTKDGELIIAPETGTSGQLYAIATDGSYPMAPWYTSASQIVKVTVSDGVSVGTSAALFYGCSHVTSMDLSGLDISGATSIANMFDGCSSLTGIDVSGFATSNVTDMSSLFNGCSSLSLLELSAFTTSSATSMGSMFDGCTNLSAIKVGAGFSFTGNGSSAPATFPTPSFAGAKGTWVSMTTGIAYSPATIASSRSGTADTYVALQDTFTFSAIEPQPYDMTGAEVKPQPTVSVGGSAISSGKYTLCYWNNTTTGTATIAAVGGNDYPGCTLTTFQIARSVKDATIATIPDQIYIQSAITPTLTVTYGQDTLTVGKDYTVVYSDASGNAVTAPVAVGAYKVTITGTGSYIGTNTADFKVCYPLADATVAAVADQPYTGSAIAPALTVKYGTASLVAGTDYAVTYKSGDTAIAFPTDIGTYTIVLTGENTYTGTITTTFKIVASSIESATIADIPVQPYTGAAVTPALDVKLGSMTLKAGVDYAVTYKSGDTAVASPTDVGTYTVVVTGIGGYTGTVKAASSFVIAYPLDKATIASIPDQAYSGSGIAPALTVTYGGATFVSGSDYTVAYKDAAGSAVAAPTEVGTYTVTITGKGRCTGTNSATFRIVRSVAQATIAAVPDQAYIASAITPALTVTYDGESLAAGTDYAVSYRDANGDAVEAPVDLGTYTIVVTGVGSYIGTKSTTFSIRRSLAQATIAPLANATYTGGDIVPTLTATCDGASLVSGRDYTVSYKDAAGKAVTAPHDAGRYTIAITGMGSYIGAANATVAFTVDPASMVAATIEAIPDQIYTGKAIAPSTVVKLGQKTLVADTDYTVSYKNEGVDVASPAEEGTYTVSVTGKGNYTGTATATTDFTIKKVSIASATVDAIADQAYTGSAVTPTLTVKLDQKTLVAGTDYTVSYKDAEDTAVAAPTAVGTYSVTITGKVGYTGTVSQSVSFSIKYPLENARIADIPVVACTGSAVTPSVTIEYGQNPDALSADTDYTLSYKDANGVSIAAPVAVGTYTVIATGKGNYMGTVSSTFRVAYSVDRATVAAIPNQTYTGSAITPSLTVTYNSTALVAGTDYTVTYKDDKDTVITAPIAVGTYTAMIAGKGNYYDEKSVTFAIVQASIVQATVGAIPDQTYTGSSIAPALTVKLGTATLAAGTDFTVLYAGSGTTSYASSTTAPSAVGTYKVTITGAGNYKDTVSQSVVFKIRYPLSLAKIADIAVQGYTGLAIAPSVVVEYGDKVLSAPDDYTLSYQDASGAEITAPVLIGTYTVIATGRGDYMGTVSTTFRIAYSVAKTTIDAIPDQAYTGSAITPALSVKYANITLVAGTDYTVTYKNAAGIVVAAPVAAGTYTVIVAGQGKYFDTKNASFTVTGSDITSASVDPIADQTYTGGVITPALVVKLGDVALVAGTDYTVTYKNAAGAAVTSPLTVGTYSVTIKGIGSCSGTVAQAVTFRIVYSLANASVTMSDVERNYTGKTLEPTLGAILNGTILVRDKDYQVVYTDVKSGEIVEAPTAAGSYKVSLTGMGIYGGTKEIDGVFMIYDASAISLGTPYIIHSAAANSLVLDAAGAVPLSGSNISIWSVNGGANQAFTFELGADGFYTLHSYADNGLVLDANMNVALGSNVSLYSANGGKNQRWIVVAAENGYMIKSAYNPAVVLDAAGAVPESGANVSVWTSNGGKNQSWLLSSLGSIANATMSVLGMTKNANGGKLAPSITLFVLGQALVEGRDYTVFYNGSTTKPSAAGTYTVTLVGAGAYTGTRTVGTFTIVDVTGMVTADLPYVIQSVADKTLVLDAAGAVPQLGSNVSAWTANGGANQAFIFELGTDGFYTLKSYANTSYVLDAAGAVPQLGSNVSLWTSNGGLNQKWVIMPVDTNEYQILSAYDTTYVLDAAGTIPVAGSNVSVWTNGGRDNQKWSFFAQNDISQAAVTTSNMTRNATGEALAPTISVKLAGMALSEGVDYTVLYNGSATLPSAGGIYQVTIAGKGVYTGSKTVGEYSLYDVSGSLKEGRPYRLTSCANTDVVLDVAGSSPVTGANVSVWTPNGGSNQAFTLELGDDGYYVIRSAANALLVLDADGSAFKSGANVSTWTYNGGMNQKWIIVPQSDGSYEIDSAYLAEDGSYLVLGTAKVTPVAGTNVAVYKASDKSWGYWTFAAAK